MMQLGKTLLRLLYGVILGWLFDLIRLANESSERRQRRNRLRRERNIYTRCQHIPPEVYKRPDPLIYCQSYLMSLGIGVTWDNPDIQLYEVGLDGNAHKPVSSHELQAGQEYEIRATIYNGSTVAPAIAMPVEFSYLSFGIGTESHPIGSTRVDLQVKGAPGHPATAAQRWRTPEEPGHYCIQVLLVWADDANPSNNLGQENVQVAIAESPAEFRFAVGNRTDVPRTIHLMADGYQIPPLDPCDPRFDGAALGHMRGRVLTESERLARLALARRRLRLHLREAHQLPSGWAVTFVPERLLLEPGEESQVITYVTPPEDWTGRQVVNVHGLDQFDRLVGGVTLYTVRA